MSVTSQSQIFTQSEIEPPITITEKAANKILELVSEEQNPKLGLRVYIVGGGCAGFQYGFAFDAARNGDDTIVEKNTIQVVVDALSMQYLRGASIDYVENLQGAHFVVINPNANTTCGCGSSFSV